MKAPLPIIRPLGYWKSIFRELKNQQPGRRSLSTVYSAPKKKLQFPQNLPEQFYSQIPAAFRPGKPAKLLKVFPPPPTPCSTVKDPIAAFTATQLAILDPTGERRALFDRKNRQGVKVGDILRVTFKSGDPFAGVCLNIRSRGVDTAFLLRNKLTKIGCEMWIKVYSPNVDGVEVVQRAEKRKRRARLTYMRKPEHDLGSVENIVRKYLREKPVLSGGSEPRNGQKQQNKQR